MKLFQQLPLPNQFRKLESVLISGAADFESIFVNKRVGLEKKQLKTLAIVRDKFDSIDNDNDDDDNDDDDDDDNDESRKSNLFGLFAHLFMSLFLFVRSFARCLFVCLFVCTSARLDCPPTSVNCIVLLLEFGRSYLRTLVRLR